MAAGPSPFCLDTKRTKKIKSAAMLLCRTWPLRCKSHKTWAVPYVRDFAHVSRCPPLLQKFPMPCHAQAAVVLPDFGRSCAADGPRIDKLKYTTSAVFLYAVAHSPAVRTGAYFKRRCCERESYTGHADNAKFA